MFKRKSKQHQYDMSGYQVITSTHTQPIRPNRFRGLTIAASGLIIMVAISVTAVLVYKNHESHHVNVTEQPKSDRVIQSPQDNAAGATSPRSSVSNGTISEPAAQ